MQASNNQPNFRAVRFTPQALKAISERMPSGKFIKLQEDFTKMYKKFPLDIKIDTTGKDSIRLTAKIDENNVKNPCEQISEFIEESVFSSIFRSPLRFFEKISKIIDEKEVQILSNTRDKKPWRT